MLTQQRLRELLTYDPATGIFRWRHARGRQAAGRVAGSRNKRGYVIISIDGQRQYAHRLALLWVHGKMPSEQTDHRNNIKFDNSLANLREATRGQNQWNAPKHADNTSGYKGVTWHKHSGRWYARICKDRKSHSLGYYADPVAAAHAYDQAALRLCGEYALTNFPLDGPARAALLKAIAHVDEALENPIR